jgi:DHA3 family macrolide efflux protein-like MFS transporter
VKVDLTEVHVEVDAIAVDECALVGPLHHNEPTARKDKRRMTIDASASSEALEIEPAHWKRNVSIFITGQTISLFGSMLVQYAVLWYLTLTTKDGVVVALATIFGFAPQAIVSIFGGVWADRHNRKFLIIASDATIAAATLTLALLMASGNDAHWLIFAALAVRSMGAGIQTPAVAALVPQLVPTSKLLRVNGINGSIQGALMLIAPAVAAVLYATVELEHILMIDVTTAVIGIAFLAVIPVARIARSSDEKVGYFTDLVDGVKYIWTHAFVRWLLLLFAGVMLFAAAPAFLTPLMVVRSFGEEVWKLTALEVAFAIGMTLGGAAVAAFGQRFSRMGLILGSLATMGVLTVALGLSPNLAVFLIVMFLVGFFIPGFSTPSMTVVQEVVEPERHGRVFGFWGIVGAVAMPLGMAIFGPMAQVMSVESVLVIAGVLMMIALAVALLAPAGRKAVKAARVSTDPLSHGAPHASEDLSVQ